MVQRDIDQIIATNFGIWQLGLLFVIIQNMEGEPVRIGSGRSRGLARFL